MNEDTLIDISEGLATLWIGRAKGQPGTPPPQVADALAHILASIKATSILERRVKQLERKVKQLEQRDAPPTARLIRTVA